MKTQSTKTCPNCKVAMIGLRGEDKKICSGGCGLEVDWPLEDGQQYMFKRNVEPIREPRTCHR